MLRLRRAGLLRIPIPRPPRAEHDCTRIVFGLVGTAKRERKKANRTARQQREQRQAKVASVRRRGGRIGALVGVGLIVVLIIAAIGGAFSGDDDTAAPSDPATPTTTVTTTAECPPEEGTEFPERDFDAAPPLCINPTATYTAEIVTSLGAFTVELDAAVAPQTVNNFVTLARYRYFDDTECHRIVTGFVVQCGDPTASGVGGPGYQFVDELPEPGSYSIGSVAMANSGPDTNGSQFFVVTGDRGAALPPNYSLFGQVIDGLETTVLAMDAAGDRSTGAAEGQDPLIIESVTIIEA